MSGLAGYEAGHSIICVYQKDMKGAILRDKSINTSSVNPNIPLDPGLLPRVKYVPVQSMPT